MINLRFHIVSIVAIFLALAIGMLAGSTLLDRATVDVLKGRQKSLDSRNSRLRAQNDELRAAIEARIPADRDFGTQVLPTLVPGLLQDDPVLIIATRGIDEDSVRALQSAVRDAGGAPLGIIWFDSRLDLDNADAVAAAATALGIDATADKAKAAVVSEIVRGLVVSGGTTTSTTTTAVPADPETTDPAAPDAEPTDVGNDPSLSVLSKLVDADLADWESPNEGEPGSRTLPAGGLDIVLLSGEGSELRASHLMVPLIKGLAARLPGAVVGEVRKPRTDIDVVDQDDVPKRGTFVNPLRSDEALSARLITVDDVDDTFGRLAVVLALAQLPTLTSGSYGIAPSAQQPFPTPTS